MSSNRFVTSSDPMDPVVQWKADKKAARAENQLFFHFGKEERILKEQQKHHTRAQKNTDVEIRRQRDEKMELRNPAPAFRK